MSLNPRNSRIPKPCVIPQLNWGISFKIPSLSNLVRGLINEIASVALLPRNDGDSRNDGDVMRSSGQARG
ncbi:MAG: hypothetical protein SPJ69_01085 [Campylobacter sp.]|uniref:hypothetical protein n=1 Tax=Campylobacter sp. TaxID=205 RepID=UPI00297BA562|nr:hypothetical protein [Campylobacter sp.]MDD7600957.1 hypothetical protein [Campylobacteraceae bacterium]MDY5886893.1 hypothetical protein [Campylobacter sp.]